MRRCGKYVGDNDGTCPQLTCIRDEGHLGACDNTYGEMPRVRAVTDRHCNHCNGAQRVVEIRFGAMDGPGLLIAVCEPCRHTLVSQFKDFDSGRRFR